MKVLRWVLFLPVAVVASIVSGLLAYLAGNIFGDTVMQTLATFLGTAVFVAVAGIVAPTHRSAVTITLTSIIALVALAAFVLSEKVLRKNEKTSAEKAAGSSRKTAKQWLSGGHYKGSAVFATSGRG